MRIKKYVMWLVMLLVVQNAYAMKIVQRQPVEITEDSSERVAHFLIKYSKKKDELGKTYEEKYTDLLKTNSKHAENVKKQLVNIESEATAWKQVQSNIMKFVLLNSLSDAFIDSQYEYSLGKYNDLKQNVYQLFKQDLLSYMDKVLSNDIDVEKYLTNISLPKYSREESNYIRLHIKRGIEELLKLNQKITEPLSMQEILKKIFVYNQSALLMDYQKYCSFNQKERMQGLEIFNQKKELLKKDLYTLINNKNKDAIFTFGYKKYNEFVEKEKRIEVNKNIKTDMLWFFDQLSTLNNNQDDDLNINNYHLFISLFESMQKNYLIRIKNYIKLKEHYGRYDDLEQVKTDADLHVEAKGSQLIENGNFIEILNSIEISNSDINNVFLKVNAEKLQNYRVRIKSEESQWSKIKDASIVHIPLFVNICMPFLIDSYMPLFVNSYMPWAAKHIGDKVKFFISLLISCDIGATIFPCLDTFHSQRKELCNLFDKKDIRWTSRGISFALVSLMQQFISRIGKLAILNRLSTMISPIITCGSYIGMYMLHYWYVTWNNATDRNKKMHYDIFYPSDILYKVRDLKRLKLYISEEVYDDSDRNSI